MLARGPHNELTPKMQVAPLITFISACGGAGKSTLALIMARMLANASMHTALIEADLQFGDYGFWLGLDIECPTLALKADCPPIVISENLDLYKAPVLPEVAEDISDEIAAYVPVIRAEHDVVIADTGQFWSGITADLLCSSDLILLLMDQRRSSVYGAIKAQALCQRLGIPAARIVCISNKCQTRSRTERSQICTSLGVDEVLFFADGKAAVESLVGSGHVEELIEQETAPVPDIGLALSKLLPRIGLEYASASKKKQRRLFS